MTTINIACSAGLESLAMLQKAMMAGYEINIIFQNLSGTMEGAISELVVLQNTLNFFTEHPDKTKYKGKIKEVYYMLGLPHLNRPNSYNSYGPSQFVSNSVSQQWATIQNLMVFRQSQLINGRYPTTWIGWIKSDAAEYSDSEFDFTESEYMAMLDAPKLIGLLGSGDRVARPFRAPLWNMDKREIWDFVDPDIRDNVLPNGSGCFNGADNEITHRVNTEKFEEYEQFGIPVRREYSISLRELTPEWNFFVRRLLRQVRAVDLDLPEEAQSLVDIAQQPRLVEPNCWIDQGEIKYLKNTLLDAVKNMYERAHKFEWPAPIPTVEILADVGDGPERVVLEGDTATHLISEI